MKSIKFTEVTEFSFDPKKSLWLKAERGFGFEEIIYLIIRGEPVDVYPHSNPSYSHQFICELIVDDYVYIVPFVVDGEKVFLKTMFPSRKATKRQKVRSKK